MKFLPLALAGIARNRTAFALVLLQVIFIFMLFGMLQGLNASMQLAMAHAHADRLFVGSAGSPLPVALTARLGKFPGVAQVAFESQLPCTYREPKDLVFGLGIDPASYFAVYGEYKAPIGQLKAFEQTRTGVLVGAVLEQRFHWKVGDRISLQCFVPNADGSKTWIFDVVGFFSQTEQPEFSNVFLINYPYLNDSRSIERDQVNIFGVKVAQPSEAADIARSIDATLENSANPTHTQSDSQVAQGSFQFIGDIGFLASAISTIGLLSLLIATGMLMMQSVRERRGEFAVMKAIGFSPPQILCLVLTQSAVTWICGALIGISLAAILLPHARHLVNAEDLALSVPPYLGAIACLVAAGLALVSGAIPAWQASRLKGSELLAEH
ncbi:MAG TPA: FtsX-like permease family protein [Steroidobacteraceae bacterium]